MAHRRNQNVPTARFDIIEPDRKMSVLHAILRKEFTSCLTMQDVSICYCDLSQLGSHILK